jgi:hypothetical protein
LWTRCPKGVELVRRQIAKYGHAQSIGQDERLGYRVQYEVVYELSQAGYVECVGHFGQVKVNVLVFDEEKDILLTVLNNLFCFFTLFTGDLSRKMVIEEKNGTQSHKGLSMMRKSP